MNGRLKLIEQQLIGIDSAAFQNLCDIYLSYREKEIASFERTGSQLGKQKTVKGTPDSFFRKSDGTLSYVEYTTTDKGIVDKIKGDIDKCLNESKTGVPLKDIHRIIICYNSNLSVDQEKEITEYAQSKHIRIELIGLSWLAIEIYSKHPLLAKDILGLPVDTGQIIPLDAFIAEYNNKGGNLSTPLDNEFLYRSIELSNIYKSIDEKNILIISGYAGVGKTKIALEAINAFVEKKPSYSAFAISKKDVDIFEDLRINLQKENDYIILIDDANRQLINLKQILGIISEKRKGNIKLVITVRNYALNDIIYECEDYNRNEIVVDKFSDDEIKGIISSDSFEIRHHAYQKKIIELADGNARVAIMAARLAKQKNHEFLRGDIFDLYDSYFRTFVKDFDLFSNNALLKTLGIISFFFTIDRTNKLFIEKILHLFKIDYHEFNEAIDELHKRELVEVQYNHVKISEQIMATYVFYVVFIKDQMLSFKELLFNYFPEYNTRFSDSIIPANNSFGFENVLKKINDTLDQYIEMNNDDEEKLLSFFSLFWFYKGPEVLAYFYKKIFSLPEPEHKEYDTKYGSNDFGFDKDPTLQMLSKYFNHYTENYISALELAHEYARRKPNKLPELVKILRDDMIFDREDEEYGFVRQIDFLNLLLKHHAKGEIHYTKSLIALIETFMSHQYSITRGGRKNTITMYQYKVQPTKPILEFRERIWNSIADLYNTHPDEIFEIIDKYKSIARDASTEILIHDLTYLLSFIDKKFDPADFKHAYSVQELIIWLERNKNIDKSTYQSIKRKFFTAEYEYFRKLDWNMRRGKLDYEFENYEQYQKLKERDIRSNFIFKDVSDFSNFHKAIKNIMSVDRSNLYAIDNSLSIVLEENFIKNKDLGFELLSSVLNNYEPNLNFLGRIFQLITNTSEEWAAKLWHLIDKWDNENRLYLKLLFFDCLPDYHVNEQYKEELQKTMSSLDRNCFVNFEMYRKFVDEDFSFLDSLHEIIVDKIEKQKLRIILPHGFFEQFPINKFKSIEVLYKSYKQQESFHQHFDYSKDGLKKLTEIDRNIIIKYVSESFVEDHGLNDFSHENFSFIWTIPGYEQLAEECINIAADRYYFLGILEHPINAFFNSLNVESLSTAKDFILTYISRYSKDTKRMNAIVDVMRHKMKDFYEEALLAYLKVNTDLENFENIYWRGNGGVYNGNVIIGEVHAKEWEAILNIVNKSEDQLNTIPIKDYIKKQIAYEYRSAEYDRKMQFIDPRE